MTNIPHKIDFVDKWNLYHFSDEDIPTAFDNLGFSSSDAETRMKYLVADGGFAIIPSSKMSTQQVEQLLTEKNQRDNIIENLAQDKPLNGILGLLNFKEDYSDVIKSVEVGKAKSSPTNGIYSENEVTIILKRGIDISTTELDLGLTVLASDYKESDGLGFDDDSTTFVEDLDVITQAVYYDEGDNKIYEEYLLPNSVNDLFQTSVDVNVTSESIKEGQDSDELGFVMPLLKKVKLFFKKIVGTVRKELVKLKNKTIDYIIDKLKPIKMAIHDPYKILKYNFHRNTFEECPPSDVDPNKKTLICLHGTAKGSFDGRLKKGDGKGSFKYLSNKKYYKNEDYDNWFELLNRHEGDIKYEQIISLEHETIMDSPMDNIKRFQEWNLRFTKFVSIVSASRGGLLAKCISNTSLARLMPIERVAIVSGGYSEYFDDKKGVKRYVNMIGNIAKLNIPIKFLLSLTIDIIIRLPGLKVQNKKTDEFKFLVNPDNVVDKDNPVYYFNMTSNYQPSSAKGKLLKKLASNILGNQNDLAVSLNAQRDFSPGITHSKFPLLVGSGQHGRGLRAYFPKKRLLEFLTADMNNII